MQHGRARTAIDGILQGSGFDNRAQALVHAGLLFDDDMVPTELAEKALQTALAMDVDLASVEKSTHLTSPLPDSVDALNAECGRLVTDYPANTAQQVSGLYHLSLLWPHASRDERLRLRLNYLASMTTRVAPVNSYVTRTQLREWQRNLPTAHDNDAPCASVLGQMLEEDRAEKAYGTLSYYLGADTDLPTLSWTLGVLTEQVLLHQFDPQGWAIQALVGTIACERMAGSMPPEILVTVVSQLSHHIWWCAQESRRRLLERHSNDKTVELVDAVMQGDIIAAERAARIQFANPAGFWKQVCHLLDHLMDLESPAWTLGLDTVIAIRSRSGPGGLFSPDDAATVGAALASAKYLATQGSRRIDRIPG